MSDEIDRVDTVELEQRISDLLDACLKEANDEDVIAGRLRADLRSAEAHVNALLREAERMLTSLMALRGNAAARSSGTVKGIIGQRRLQLAKGEDVE